MDLRSFMTATVPVAPSRLGERCRAAHEQGTGASCPGLRVVVLCAVTLLRERLDAAIRADSRVELCRPDASTPADLSLWAAGSGRDLQRLRAACRSTPRCGAVLLDTAGQIGPVGAGLHGFRGYLPPETDAERLRLCLRRVAAGQPDAPEPHLVALVRTLALPPLDEAERAILRLLALGRSQREMQDALSMSARTLQRRIADLQARLGGNSSSHLAAIAVALGVGSPWEPGAGLE
jgi:DNA-binding CsgD family transcriptional regulator